MSAVRKLLQKFGLVPRGSDDRLGSLHDKRRALRLPITMPVAVYGYVGDEPFLENTESINVSARGGLVAISAGVNCWQKIILTNLQTEEDLECRIVRLAKSATGTSIAAVEFADVAPKFWRTGIGPATS